MELNIPGQKVTIPDPFDPAPLLQRIAALESQPAAIPVPVDLGPINAAIKILQGQVKVLQADTLTSKRRLFATSSFWNTKLQPDAPIHPNSAKFVADLIRQTKPDASKGIQWPPAFACERCPSIYIVTDPNIPKVPVKIVSNGVTLAKTAIYKIFMEGIRIPVSALPSNVVDSAMGIWDKVDDIYSDFWQMRKVNGEWQASWGGQIKDVSNSDGIMPTLIDGYGNPEKTGCTATGLPHAGHLIKLAELKAGVIPHVIGITTPNIPNRWVWPAQRCDSGGPFYPDSPPEGTRYRLPADFIIPASAAPLTRMVMQAIKDYGIVQYDRGENVVIPIENTTQYGETIAQFMNGMTIYDANLLAQIPFDKFKVLA